jgi:hypothetical protein
MVDKDKISDWIDNTLMDSVPYLFDALWHLEQQYPSLHEKIMMLIWKYAEAYSEEA